MAKITDARKVEVLRTLDISEGSTTLQVRGSNEGTVSIRVEIADPAREERRTLRDWIMSREDGTVGADILELLDQRDADATLTFGDKGPRKHSIDLWLDAETATALANAIDNVDLHYIVGNTIRDALTNKVDTRGF